MAGRLSFSIAINLLTENFKRGTNQVKAAFRSMQMQILTFAAAFKPHRTPNKHVKPHYQA